MPSDRSRQLANLQRTLTALTQAEMWLHWSHMSEAPDLDSQLALKKSIGDVQDAIASVKTVYLAFSRAPETEYAESET